jgi:hypothetical protein
MDAEEDLQDCGDDQLCETCRQIDLQPLLKSPSKNAYLIDYQLPYIRMTFSEGCRFCCLLLRGSPSRWKRDGFEFDLQASSYFAISKTQGYDKVVKTYDDNVAGRDSSILKVNPSGEHRLDVFGDDWIFCRPHLESSDGLFQPRPISRVCDYSVVRSWLKNCIDFHNCDGDDVPTLIQGMRLIDCLNLNVVAATSASRWIALSYVWGPQHQPNAADVTGSTAMTDLGQIPKTVRDAIIVTNNLGYRYLWVDEFCIDQNDETHRLDQIQKMDGICKESGANSLSERTC